MERFRNKVWLSSPTMHGPELEYMKQAYETNWMSTVGENINEAERLACEKIGCKYAVALSAGTAALHMAVKLAGVKPGEKVFCSDMTFDATVNPVVYEGGDPKEAAVKKKALRHSNRAIVLADKSKFNQISSVKFADIQEAEIITEQLDDIRYRTLTTIKEVFS